MYIDAYHAGDQVYVLERDQSGNRRTRKFPAPYFYYYEEPDPGKATHVGIDGKPLSVARFGRRWDMRDAVESLRTQGVQLYESDVKTEYRLLEAEYAGKPVPALKFAVVDIEVYSQRMGFPKWDNARAPINAVSVYYSWTGSTVTLVVAPPGWDVAQLQAALDAEGMEDTFALATEAELLMALVELVEEADVTTGWNSERFDMPYIVSRIRQVLGDEDFEEFFAKENKEDKPTAASLGWLNRMGGFGFAPRKGSVFDKGTRHVTFTFPGKPHLDYIELYKKFVLEPRDSHKLGEILEVELGVGKVEFEGSLDNLYEKNPVIFAKYNRRDVTGIGDLDKKLGLIEIANAMVHRACVLLPDATGSVNKIEQAILMRLHQRGQIAKDKNIPETSESVAGAWVYQPVAGLYEWATNFDVKSLYPSIISLVNISPEKLVGQFKLPATEAKIRDLIANGAEGAEIWHDFTGVLEYHAIVDEDPWQTLTLQLEDGEEITLPADKWKGHLKEMGLLISANGTVFSDEQGIIPLCISEWFAERKEFQKKAKAAKAAGDMVQYEYWNRQQAVMKVFLNSTYGALLNEYFRWFDRRMGQSVTLSGRVVSKHLYRQVNKELLGKYEFGKSIIYGDTDSVYLTLAHSNPQSVDEAVKLADETRAKVDATLDEFVQKSFLAAKNTITIEREMVASRGLFRDKKKRYALWVVDKEKDRKPFMYIVGMDSKRTEIPKFIRRFLQECMEVVVRDRKGESDVKRMVTEFQATAAEANPWAIGFFTSVSNVEHSSALRKAAEMSGTKAKIHHGVTAADNTNRYIKFFGESAEMDYIRDGDRISILKLRQDPGRNPLEVSTVGLPLDVQPPAWFKKLPFDVEANLETALYKKLDLTFDGLGWNVRPSKVAADEMFG